jgi:hypothetical protein
VIKQHVLLFIVTIALLLTTSGCSSKKYFEPEFTHGDYDISGSLEEVIVDTNSEGAVLSNGKVISKDGLEDATLKNGYTFISKSGGYIISGSINGTLNFEVLDKKDVNESSDIKIELKKTVAGVTLKDDILAVLFANNEMALYQFSTQKLILKEQGNAPAVLDNRIVNPYFLNDLVLFLTLDGKVVIISTQTKEVLRSSIVSSADNFNNVIYFNVINNKLLAATPTRLLLISEKESRNSFELRDIVFDDDGIWLSTKQGEVFFLSDTFEVKAKQKFPFAHFLGMVVKDKIYLLEKEGYLIVVEKDFSEYKVYEVDVDDGYVFVGKDRIYFDDNYITFK